jgi:uncharacterized OB-fold protein
MNCGRYYHPPIGLCINCLSSDLSFEKVSGRAKVLEYSVTYDARQPAFQAITPYAVAVVSLEEQGDLIMLSNLPGVPLEAIASGLEVELMFEAVSGGMLIPQFGWPADARGGEK